MSTLKTVAELEAFLALPRGLLFIDVVWSTPCAESRDAVVAFFQSWKEAEPDSGVTFARVDASDQEGEVFDRLKAWFNGAGFPGPELMKGGNGPVAWSRASVMAGVVLSAARAGTDELSAHTRSVFGLDAAQ